MPRFSLRAIYLMCGHRVQVKKAYRLNCEVALDSLAAML
jgi:hypothetical protein